MSEQTAHLLNYKDENGKWNAIPVIAQTMYATYVNRCAYLGIESISEEAYLNTLVEFTEIAKAFIETADTSILRIERGGTGAANARDARFYLNVLSASEVEAVAQAAFAGVDAQVQDLIDRIAQLESDLKDLKDAMDRITPAKCGINFGDSAPTSETTGTVYFEY